MPMEASVNIDPRTIMTRPGIMPSCFTVAGRAMIPAPTIVVERLKTAPENDAPSKPDSSGSRSSSFWGRRGILGLRRHLRSMEGRIVISVRFFRTLTVNVADERGMERGIRQLTDNKLLGVSDSYLRKIGALESYSRGNQTFLVLQANEVVTRVPDVWLWTKWSS